MADWPGVPLEGDLAAGLDGNVGTVALALLVANDGGSAKAVRGDETVVKVVGLPSFGTKSVYVSRAVRTESLTLRWREWGSGT